MAATINVQNNCMHLDLLKRKINEPFYKIITSDRSWKSTLLKLSIKTLHAKIREHHSDDDHANELEAAT